MESYEEFCLRSLSVLQEKGKFKRSFEPLTKTYSVILFCGKAVLSPVLNAEQRHEMCNYRMMAVQLEADQRNQQRNKLPVQVGDIVASCITQSGDLVAKETQDSDKPVCKVQQLPRDELEKSSPSKPATLSGYTLITDSPGLPKDSGIGLQTCLQLISPAVPNGLIAGDEGMVEAEDKSDEEDMSMDSLLKQTKEDYQQSKDVSEVVIPTSEANSEKESPKGGVEFGFSLHHSPLGPPQTHIHQTVHDPQQPVSSCIPDRYIRRHSPESSFSPQVQRRKPRPFSTGNINISFLGMPGEGSGLSDWKEALSLDHWSSVGSESVLNRRGSRQSSFCASSPVRENHSPMSPLGPSPIGQPERLSSTFRRRSHTMDSQLGTNQAGPDHIDRSLERTPRFMAGVVTISPSSRRNSAAPLNKSYRVENRSPHLQWAHVTPELTQAKHRTDPDDPRGQRELHTNTEETQRRTLEDMQRQLEEEHALQMSVLLAEQEKEQQHLRLELEDSERRLREQESACLQSSDACRWNGLPAGSPFTSGISPAHVSAERSPGHSKGFPIPVSPKATSPSVLSPTYLRGPIWAAGKPHARQCQVLTAEQQRALCRIGAIARGFLMRRLLKTHKVKHLRQTITDTQAFISSFQSEAPLKRVSEQDLCLQERVRAQLRAALYDIHEIFFEMPLEDRLVLLQQDRELCVEKKLRDMDKAKSHKEKVILSAATQRSLDRKKREGESPGQARKVMQKPKSPTPNRAQKSSQVQKSVPSQLNRQGSWCKKTPETRVKRMDNLKNLKKQHSLG
ncbi:centriolar coiled-coil protein of 110 kDa-like [Dunckerocampus dactyliophorus]|uniref:centriolar coiled-coil protein of 110 kDa-like n=1 Tax=Dunckerocampus dactyliophorus TaxID=161453 RepID=UPI002404E69B|nr:centriolar coiled-coil protein of 110 kDa-like [Dunckerocampus dactyliophorus]